MSQLLGALAGILALGVIVAIPVAIVTLGSRAQAERARGILAWGAAHGMQPTAASAVPPSLQALYTGVVSMSWGAGVLSALTVSTRVGQTTTFWASLPGARVRETAYAHRGTGFGSGIGHVTAAVPTGDADFDARFTARATEAQAVRSVFTDALRAEMLAFPSVLDTVSWDGAIASVTISDPPDDATLDRMLALLETVRRATHGGA